MLSNEQIRNLIQVAKTTKAAGDMQAATVILKVPVGAADREAAREALRSQMAANMALEAATSLGVLEPRLSEPCRILGLDDNDEVVMTPHVTPAAIGARFPVVRNQM